MRKLFRFLIFIGLLVILWLVFSTYLLPKLSPPPDSTTTSPTSATPITTVKPSASGNSFLPTSGTVVSRTQINVFPSASSTIKKLYIQEGDYVQAGDPIIELTGPNGTPHQTEIQYQVALQNYNFAKQSYQNVLSGGQTTIETAQLQLQNANNQFQSFQTDLSTLDKNISTLQHGLNLLNNSLSSSRSKTARDLEFAHQNLNDLSSAISELQNQKMHALSVCRSPLHELADNTDQAWVSNSTSLSCPAVIELDKTLNDLYNSFDKAKVAYNDAIALSRISDNQSVSQLLQTKNQLAAAELSKQSALQKAGYNGESIIAVGLAEKAFAASQKQLHALYDQAANQLKLAALNLELAESQFDQLILSAPQSGIIAGLNVKVNDNVSALTKLFSVITPNDFELVLAVDIETANRLSVQQSAEIQIAGKWLPAKVSSVGQLPDFKTKLVEVKVALPKIFFRSGQILNVRLPLQVTQSLIPPQIGDSSSPVPASLFLPLDAVIIGTQEKFVYIVENPAGEGVDSQKAKKITVTTGLIVGDQIEILSGLSGSEKVILEGSHNLVDGQSVSF